METFEMMGMVKAMTDETDEAVISAFLSFAAKSLYRYWDPFGQSSEEEFQRRFPDVVVDAAAYKLNKRGWDYQITYTENGVRREYEDGDIPASILNRITPLAKVARVSG